MYNTLLAFILMLFVGQLFAQDQKPEDTEVWDPEVTKVQAGKTVRDAPADATVLFDGTSTDAFVSLDGSPVKWKVIDGAMEVVAGTGDIVTKETFGSCQLHLEFMTSDNGKEGQANGNSGVFLQGLYEVQILNSNVSRTYNNGQAGAVYKQYAPLVNVTKPAYEWQTYDIIFTAPTWNENGSRKSPGYLTVFHNGVLIQNHIELQGTTEYIGPPRNVAHGDGPIKLQDHSDPNRFRNIWIRRL